MDFLCEHVVGRKKEGLYRFKKSAIIALLIIVPLLIILTCMAFANQVVYLRYSIFLVPLFVWLGAKLGPILAAYGEEAYEYSIASGEIEFATIYGDRFRREIIAFELKDLEACKPYFSNDRSLENERFDVTYKAVSSMNAPHIYYAVFKDKKDNRCIIYFEVTKKSLKMIKTYYPQTVMTVIDD